MKNSILVVDDEPAIRFGIQSVFENSDVVVRLASNSEEALLVFRDCVPDVVLLDLRLGSENGMDLFHSLRVLDPKCLVVFMTGFGTSNTAIEAMKIGAYDYLVKPLDADQLQSIVEQAHAIRRMTRTPAITEESLHAVDTPDLIIGSSPPMRTIFKQIGRVASQDVNVLILGESGTGKELVARAIFQHGRRNQQPFLAINCAALPEMLLESELFGHEKGAFTGAFQQRLGKFEQANGGTIFLDEIGDMALGTQAKMLRVLQEGSFERVGGNQAVRVNVRVISATNHNLEKQIEEGRFRADLYYRLNGMKIQLPPLRDRVTDIPELAHYFLFRAQRDMDQKVYNIAEETLERLMGYPWPGNVRELENAIREASLNSAGDVLLAEFLPPHVGKFSLAHSNTAEIDIGHVSWEALQEFVFREVHEGNTGIYRKALTLFDRLIIAAALDKSKGNQALAAEMLGLSRPTLRGKLKMLAGHVPVSLPNAKT